ncbi:unnamed protein product [Acanthoscelides obtectus]|uniref:Uncharacterized protein n=1 Tax=Acanthoscelides obtectus TaxID=200917 RepID=A0A9P0JXL2_ACAOB|nr:unnamed protein product [Acanthoscelides obtectus]CAK1663982.1 hypothetical protein AOBTE_LOCUS23978 [Acanthoscelides obtectus]
MQTLDRKLDEEEENSILEMESVGLYGNKETEINELTMDKNNLSVLKGHFVTPFELRGFPKAAPRKNLNRKRKTKKSIILTSTPEMKNLSYKTLETKTPNTTAVEKVNRNISGNLNRNDKTKKRKMKEKILNETDSESEDNNLL